MDTFQQKIQSLEQQDQELQPGEGKTCCKWARDIQIFRHNRRQREGGLQERDVALHETILDEQKLLQDAQEGLQRKGDVGLSRMKLRILKTQMKDEEPIEAGGVQQGDEHTVLRRSSSKHAASLRRPVKQKNALLAGHLHTEVRNLEDWCLRLSAEVERRGKKSSRRTAHRAHCSRGSQSGAVTSFTQRLAREALG